MNQENPRKLNIKTINHGDQGSLSVVDFKSVFTHLILKDAFIFMM